MLNDVIKWKHFPRYWPFVRGIHRWPVNSPHKVQWRGALMFSLIFALNKRLSKQSRSWWFEPPSCSLWRHCNGYRWWWVTSTNQPWRTGVLEIDKYRSTTKHNKAWTVATFPGMHRISVAHDDVIKWKLFSVLLALCAGNSLVTGEFPSQRPVSRSFDVFFDLHLNKRLSKQSRCWWFKTPSRSLWHHCNGSQLTHWGLATRIWISVLFHPCFR